MYDRMMVRRTAEQAAGTRRDLLQAALQVFGECGYAAATLGEIARRAGVTRGALYHHFTDKTDVYDAVLREEADEVMRPLMAELAGGGPPLERLRSFVMSYCDALERDANFRAVLEILLFGGAGGSQHAQTQTRRGYEAWLGAFQALFEQAHKRGELRAGVSPRAASVAVVALAAGMTTTALQSPGLLSPSQAAASLVDVLLEGIAA